MNLVEFGFVYVGLLGLFIFILLFGETPLFQGTPVSFVHWLITSGIWEGVWLVAGKICGNWGISALDKTQHACCERSNPLLQIAYLLILMVAYYLYEREFLSMLPFPGIPAWHRWTALASVTTCLAVFLGTSASDPGTVTKATLQRYSAMYQYDNVTCSRKVCDTCILLRPPRSKHCPACDRCVARFDHHCAWINSDVGLLNLRWFLLFLTCNLLLCIYGLCLGVSIVGGALDRHQVRDMAFWDPSQDKWVVVGHQFRPLLEWALKMYSTGVTIMVFLGIAALMMTCFLGYHLMLVARGMTTYETFKRRLWQEEATYAAEVEAADRYGMDDMRSVHDHSSGKTSGWVWWTWRRKRRKLVSIPPHLYSKGLMSNFWEVLFPLVPRSKLT
ncbi:hypothetical protein WJX74_000497 [Apatococcus lobatus]|uniref:S-acyltransferase n=1 Tax=Apatococcus lobatus TaxID=904363 RepID=A0AAW1RPA8_9CHLO